MNGRPVFSEGDLIEILITVIREHCNASERSSYSRSASTARPAEDFANLTMQVDFAALAHLADHLRIVTAVDTAGSLDILAHLMADVAMAVYKGGPIFADKRHKLEQINALGFKIRTGFSVACAECFAQSLGYAINLASPSNNQISVLFLVDNWEGLVRVFGGSLDPATRNMEQKYRSIIGDDSAGAFRYFEKQFDRISLDENTSEVEVDRRLSAESYWNLRSVADRERWSDADVLELIEAQLSPARHPHLAFRSVTVTGDEWQRLHNWIKREGGYTLWQRHDDALSRK
jgi:hypothetical protein